ncbi:MAG: hypothetical protein COX70_09570 [Flavobacteriales bacterium CG_4_10_14_0_2_um_filter_32_8]|nr:MAG: hypothetical protein COX70_09570 [Flavobacteriales bacterium CG_4_10_14_0_2_um_filter_32_8]
MRFLFVVGFVLIFGWSLTAQTTFENTEGVVSFLSSQSVYVKYKSTEGILMGDTLFTTINNQLTPSLVVKNLSSTSVVCTPISLTNFNLEDKIIAKRRIENKKPEKIKPINTDSITALVDTTNKSQEKLNNKTNNELVSGRIAISSYANFSNTPAKSSYVVNYAFSLNINNINNSKFSLESNILFRQENGKWNEIKSNVFNGLKIYGLAIKYNIDKNTLILLGRKTNPKISSLGCMDGLQVEKSFHNMFAGGFVGSRPSYLNYSFNFNLFQYGAYFGHRLRTPKRNMQNSIAIIDQTNNFVTDRRFFTFQHNNSLLKNINVFYTLEADLYKVVNEQKQNVINLTNNYFSLRYQPFRRLTLSGTYDSRKNVIYYETNKDYLSTLIDTEARQGLSAQINYKISKNLFIGVKAGTRFQKNDSRETRNAYGFITYNNMFKSQLSTTFSSTRLESNYLNGAIYHLSFSRGFNEGKTNVSLGYSYVNYEVLKAELPLIQYIANLTISRALANKFYFSFNMESNFEKPNQFYRLYLQLSKRF